MTEAERIKFRTKLSDIVWGHLESKNFKQMTDQQIFNELPEIWNKIDIAGILTPEIRGSFTYNDFVNIAVAQFQRIEFEKHFFGRR
jgi:hypothetical protein